MHISSPTLNDQMYQSDNSNRATQNTNLMFPKRKMLPVPFISMNTSNSTEHKQNKTDTIIKNTTDNNTNFNYLQKDDESEAVMNSPQKMNDTRHIIPIHDVKKSSQSTSDSTQNLNDLQQTELKKSNRKTRVPFTQEEDEKIKYLVNLYGNKHWSLIASYLNKRTPKQCRDRYTNYLVPGLFKGEWSNEEDELLKKLYYQNGPKWSVFKNSFPGRSANSIKNRWNYFLSRQEMKNSNENCGLTNIKVTSKSNMKDGFQNDEVLNALFYQSCEVINKSDEDAFKENSNDVTNLLENEILETDNIIDFSHDWYVF